MNQLTTSFQIAIGPRIAEYIYPVRAITARTEVRSELKLPERLITRATQLLQAQASPPISDLAAIGQHVARLLFTPLLQDLLLRTTRAAAKEGKRIQLQLLIEAPELVVLPWEWLTLGQERPWRPALRHDFT